MLAADACRRNPFAPAISYSNPLLPQMSNCLPACRLPPTPCPPSLPTWPDYNTLGAGWVQGVGARLQTPHNVTKIQKKITKNVLRVPLLLPPRSPTHTHRRARIKRELFIKQSTATNSHVFPFLGERGGEKERRGLLVITSTAIGFRNTGLNGLQFFGPTKEAR